MDLPQYHVTVKYFVLRKIHCKSFAFVISTILLSIISLLSEENTSSPANVDASVAYRKWVESKGRDSFYEDIVRSQFHFAK